MLRFISQLYLGGTMAAYITVGATTTHGGKVISGSLHTTHYGFPISRKGDKVICKKCKKITTIVTGDSSYIVDGAPVARAGDATSCGAKLIAVQQSFGESDFEVGGIESDPEEMAKWADDAVAQAEEDGLWAGPPIVHRNPNGSLETEQLSPLSSKKNLDRLATNSEMFDHYRFGKGEALTLDNLGATETLNKVILRRGAFDREGSIQSRFGVQIAEKYDNGDSDYSFDNGYNFGAEGLPWAFGSGDLSGIFNGNINKLSNGSFHLQGQVTYKFSDIFQDPYDTWDWVEGSWDPNGTPYKITGMIKNNINTVITPEEIN